MCIVTRVLFLQCFGCSAIATAGNVCSLLRIFFRITGEGNRTFSAVEGADHQVHDAQVYWVRPRVLRSTPRQV